MDIATETSPWRFASNSVTDADECDRCGSDVRRQTAVEQGDAGEPLLCPDCEFGSD